LLDVRKDLGEFRGEFFFVARTHFQPGKERNMPHILDGNAHCLGLGGGNDGALRGNFRLGQVNDQLGVFDGEFLFAFFCELHDDLTFFVLAVSDYNLALTKLRVANNSALLYIGLKNDHLEAGPWSQFGAFATSAPVRWGHRRVALKGLLANARGGRHFPLRNGSVRNRIRPEIKTQEFSMESKRVVAGVLAILLGGLGIHRFILGDAVGGILRIVITFVTCGLGSLIGLIEGIIYLTKSDAEFVQTYQVEKKAWF